MSEQPMSDWTFYIDYGDAANFKISEIWPDGDAPENPTADDVIERIKTTTARHTFALDWGLYPNATVDGKRVW